MPVFVRRLPLLCFLLSHVSLFGWATNPVLNMQLRPTYAQSGKADGLAVAYSFTPATSKPRPLDLQFDLLAPSLVRNSDQVTTLVVKDAQGLVSMTKPVIKKIDGQTIQHWRASRLVVGTIHVTYQIPVANAIAIKRGPHIDLQAAGGGVSGGGKGFLLLPVLPKSFTLQLSWQLMAGATGVSNYGVGDRTVSTNADEMLYGQFLAGPLYQYPTHPTDHGFSAYGLGRTAAEVGTRVAGCSG